MVRHFGYYSTRSRAKCRESAQQAEDGVVDKAPNEIRSPEANERRRRWADLIRLVFDADVLVCPRCSGRMRVIATIMKRDAIRAILETCGFPADSPPRAPPESPPDESYWDAA